MRIIAGPCQHETLAQSAAIAQKCKAVCDKYGVEYIFKASFDKANRSSLGNKRGVGLANTLNDFKLIKEVHGVKTLTDVHDIEQIEIITTYFNECVDVLQIPAFLCRQTKTEGAKEVWITERGTSFGYNTLVVDFTGLDYMLNNYDYPVVLDATHSVQKPGGNGGSSGGNRDYVPGLCRAGSALGIRNFFLEVHPNPDNAPSDGPNMLRLDDFEKVVADIVKYQYE